MDARIKSSQGKGYLKAGLRSTIMNNIRKDVDAPSENKNNSTMGCRKKTTSSKHENTKSGKSDKSKGTQVKTPSCQRQIDQQTFMRISVFFRRVYKAYLDSEKPPDGAETFIPLVKDIVRREPHLLFSRLEIELQEFVIELKLRQLELISCIENEGSQIFLYCTFLFCLMEGYEKMMDAARKLAPMLSSLETEHLLQYDLTWKIMNQHMYHKDVFMEPMIQTIIPSILNKLNALNDPKEVGEFNRRILRQYGQFTDDMAFITERWKEYDATIVKLNMYYDKTAPVCEIPDCNCNRLGDITPNPSDYSLRSLTEKGIRLHQGESLLWRDSNFIITKSMAKMANKCDHRAAINMSRYISSEMQYEQSVRDPMHVPLRDGLVTHHVETQIRKVYSDLYKNSDHMFPKYGLEHKSIPKGSMKDIDSNYSKHKSGTSELSPKNKSEKLGDCQALSIKEMINLSPKERKKILQGHDELLRRSRQPQPHPQYMDHFLETKSLIVNDSPPKKQQQQQSQTQQKEIKQSSSTSSQNGTQGVSSKTICQTTTTVSVCKHGHTTKKIVSKRGHVKQTVFTDVKATVHHSVCPMHENTYKRVTCIHTDDEDMSGCNGCSMTKDCRGAGDVRNSQFPHGDCCPCNLCGMFVSQPPTAPVSRQYQESRRRLRNKLKNKNKTQPSINASVKQTVTITFDPQKKENLSPEAILLMKKREREQKLQEKHNNIEKEKSKEKEKENSKEKLKEKLVSTGNNNNINNASNSTHKNNDSDYKGDKSLEEILNFIEGNTVQNCKRAEKKERRRLRQLEEERKRKEEEEERERIRLAEIRKAEEEEERKRQELLRQQKQKKGNKKGNKNQKNIQQNDKKQTNQKENQKPKQTNREKEPEEKPQKGKKGGKLAEQKPQNVQELKSKKVTEAAGLSIKQKNQLKKQESKNATQQAVKATAPQQQSVKATNPKQKAGGPKQIQTQGNKEKTTMHGQKKGNDKKEVPVETSLKQLATKMNGEVKQPQMVTIKRDMNSNPMEPTVTITLRGSKPSEDKVLYTLQNGHVSEVNNKNGTADQSKKSKKAVGGGENDVKDERKEEQQYKTPPIPSRYYQQFGGNSFMPSVTYNGQPLNAFTTPPPNFNPSQSLFNSPPPAFNVPPMTNFNNSVPPPLPSVASNMPPPPPRQAESELTTPTAIQISNAVNELSTRCGNNFNFDNIKLPPGITITKVDPSTVQRKPLQVKQQPPPPPPPSRPPMQQPILQNIIHAPTPSSNVIVVDTGDKQNSLQGENGKKKKRRGKKKNKGQNGTMDFPESSGLTNGIINRIGGNSSFMNGTTDYRNNPHPPAIIEMNGSMVTIRNPAIHPAFASQPLFSSNIPTMNRHGHCDDNTLHTENNKDVVEDDDKDDDECERELEAFKRFCSQSVPAESKAKVNLNIEDIMKKKPYLNGY